MKYFFLILTYLACHQSLAGNFTASFKGGNLRSDGREGSASGISIGYQLNRYFRLEMDHLNGDLECCSGRFKNDYTNTGIYAHFKSSGKVYQFGKIGYINADAFGKKFGRGSLGVGLGFRVSDAFSAEIEFTKLEDSLKYFGLAGRFWF